MDTKRILEIILSFCIGWMIYSMLFEREGHSFLSMATIDDVTQGGIIADEPGDEEDEANEEDEEEEDEDDDYEEAMVDDDDGLMPEGTGL
jgi:hypothetical protein